MIRVVIADDHVLVRTALARMVDAAEDIAVVGQADDGEAAIELTRELHPDVVLMDLSMPGVDGSSATRLIRERWPDVQVVVLTSFSGRDDVLTALDAGATGYLLKDATGLQLLEAVRAANAGGSPLTPRVASQLLAARRRGKEPLRELSARELEVLDLVGQGLANKVISRRLGISERTVKAHLSRIFSVLGVSDRTQAALWAQRRRGLMGGDGPAGASR